MATEIFVSYSHADATYLAEDSLLGHLKGLENDGARFFSDKKIQPGENWDERIKAQIALADIALVLVSQMFLTSKYCQENEMKPFLRRAREQGLIIFPVILSACDWRQQDWLHSRQFIPAGGQNIEEHFHEPPGKRKAIFQDITDALRRRVKTIEEGKLNGSSSTAVAMNAFSKSVNIINKMFPQLESFHNEQPEQHREYGVVYEGRGDHIVAKNRGNQTTLTPSDLEKLSERQLRHISIFQEELEESYDRWDELYRQRRDELPHVSSETVKRIGLVVAEMKDSLDRVFAFLKDANLKIDDHYSIFQHVIAVEAKRAYRTSPTG